MDSQEAKDEGSPTSSDKGFRQKVSQYTGHKKKSDCRSSKDQGKQTWRMLNLAAICATRVRAKPISCQNYATLASPTCKAKGESHGLHGQIPLDQSEPCLHTDHHGHLNMRNPTSYEKRSSTQPVSLCSYTCLKLSVITGTLKSVLLRSPTQLSILLQGSC